MAGEELNVKKMKVPELKKALKERGLTTDGLKGDLVNRLEAYLEEQEFALPGEDGLPPTPPNTATAKTTVAEEPPVPAPTLGEAKETSPPKEVEEKPVEDTAKAEAEKEAPVAGTEPAPAPVVPEPTKAETAMSFQDKKAARAARFGIPLVEKKKKPATPKKKRPQNDNAGKGSNKKQKKQQQGNKKQKNTSQKKQQQEKKEKPLLPVEEIEKRLKRAEKFGTGDSAQTAELKAMLRKHRFAATS